MREVTSSFKNRKGIQNDFDKLERWYEISKVKSNNYCTLIHMGKSNQMCKQKITGEAVILKKKI